VKHHGVNEQNPKNNGIRIVMNNMLAPITQLGPEVAALAVLGGTTLWNILTTKDFGQLRENIKTVSNLNPWQQKTYKARIEDFAHCKNELENLGYTLQLTEAEQSSPNSGAVKALQDYMNEVIEDKVEFLRNALLNGFYGDYSLELREDLYEIMSTLQPLDLHILKYLVSVCPSQTDYMALYLAGEEAKQPLVIERRADRLSAEDYDEQCRKADAPYLKLEQSLFYPAIKHQFQEPSDNVIRRALDRLKTAGLIDSIGANRYGLYNSYTGFVPLDFAAIFLNFIADPRNSKS
jgi:hypothetical protein